MLTFSAVEIQIRTIIQHAWSSLDHRIIYKQDVPDELSRAVERLAALFEIADSEFMQIRETAQHQIKLTEEKNKKIDSNSEIKEDGTLSKKDEKTLDYVTFRNFLQMKAPSFSFYDYRANSMLNEILLIDGTFNLTTLVSSYEKYSRNVKEFRKQNSILAMNPYTELRHILYSSDKEKFGQLLTELQRNNFDKFLENQTEK